jgi:serine/threonine protein kinase
VKSPIQPLRDGDPKSFQGWTLKGFIAEGGQSTIYLAEKKNQLAALKVIRKENLHNELAVDRFFTEIKNLELLDHPNIARYVESNTNTLVPYFAVEYVDGLNLEVHVKQNGPVMGDQWYELALSLAETLNYCHSQNVIHKDVSPGNIVLGNSGPVLIDFGLSYLEKDPRLTSVELTVGTPPFMSPEQFGLERTIAMDIFSLAGTLIFAGTGHYPFPGNTAREWQEAISYELPNFEQLTQDQKQALVPLLYKASSQRLSLDIFIAHLRDHLGIEKLNEQNSKQLIETLTQADRKLIRVKPSNEIQNTFARRNVKNFLLSIGTAAIATVLGISLLSGTEKNAIEVITSPAASPKVSPAATPDTSPKVSASQLLGAFGGKTSNAGETPGASNSPTCSDFTYRDNVEEDVLRTCQALINSGDLNGYYHIGFYYYEQGDAKDAISWWQKGADKKSALSMYRLAGVLYENGETSQAKKWYQSCVDAATSDGAKSCCMNGLGKFYFLEMDMKQSRRWYQASADLGDQEGYYRVGMNYASTKEWQKALDNYLKIKKPNLATKTLIAEAYDGLANKDQALVWYQSAAEDGSADALVNVGVIYYLKKDFPKAIAAWKKASDLGSGTASYKLARLYIERDDPEEAAKYDKVGASQGEIGSIFFYGFYLQGKGDYVNAKVWYQKGVDKNDPTSMVQLGAILNVVDDNNSEACKLWVRAADLGNAKAKENVAKFCS